MKCFVTLDRSEFAPRNRDSINHRHVYYISDTEDPVREYHSVTCRTDVCSLDMVAVAGTDTITVDSFLQRKTKRPDDVRPHRCVAWLQASRVQHLERMLMVAPARSYGRHPPRSHGHFSELCLETGQVFTGTRCILLQIITTKWLDTKPSLDGLYIRVTCT